MVQIIRPDDFHAQKHFSAFLLESDVVAWRFGVPAPFKRIRMMLGVGIPVYVCVHRRSGKTTNDWRENDLS